MISRLYNMLETLQEYKRDKTTLMPEYIETRLNKSFQQYDKEIKQSLLFLTQKHEKSIMKRITKIDAKLNK